MKMVANNRTFIRHSADTLSALRELPQSVFGQPPPRLSSMLAADTHLQREPAGHSPQQGTCDQPG
jgi:hypothetical protein